MQSLVIIEILSQVLLVHQVRIFPPAQDDLDWSALVLPLVLVQRGQDVVSGEGVEVVLGGQAVLRQTRVDFAVRDLRSQWRPGVKCQRGRNIDGEWPGEKMISVRFPWKNEQGFTYSSGLKRFSV